MATDKVVGILNRVSPGASKARLGTRLGDAIDNVRSLNDLFLNVTTSAPGLAIGTGSKTKVLIANTFSFLVDGVPAQKTTAEVAFTATTHDITANAAATRERWYLFSIVAAGTVTVTAGTQGAAGAGTIPATPAGGVPIGLLKITVAAGATDFDATTDELDEAHLTDVYYDLVGVPNPTDLLAAQAAQPAAII
jgi:hypothetical protein